MAPDGTPLKHLQAGRLGRQGRQGRQAGMAGRKASRQAGRQSWLVGGLVGLVAWMLIVMMMGVGIGRNSVMEGMRVRRISDTLELRGARRIRHSICAYIYIDTYM